MGLLLIQPLMYLLPRVVFRFFLMLLIKLHILIYMSVQNRKILKKNINTLHLFQENSPLLYICLVLPAEIANRHLIGFIQ